MVKPLINCGKEEELAETRKNRKDFVSIEFRRQRTETQPGRVPVKKIGLNIGDRSED